MMPEDISPGDWLTREVFARFGLAVYESQVLENGIVNLVVWSGLRDRRYRTYEETVTDNAELFRQTLGSVRRILVSRRPDIGHLDDLLIKAVRLRNFLAHQYFRQRAAAFMTEVGQKQMIKELDEATAFFREVDDRIKPLVMEIIEALGVSKHMPGALEDVMQEGFGDPLPGL
jgi:hypothetical protein